MDKLSIKLEIFEGPLDLLLHLIQKNKLSIYDIKITIVTKQYIDYLNKMKELDLEVASEFLVILAQLLYIKSKMLLPKTNEENLEDDPRQELIEKLLEYQKYKETIGFFTEREKTGSITLVKTPEKLEFESFEYSYTNANLDELLKALNQIIKKVERQKPPPKEPFEKLLRHKVFSVIEKQSYVLELIFKKEKLKFLEIFNGFFERGEIVATFLAILELVRLKKIIIKIGKNGNIVLQKKSVI